MSGPAKTATVTQQFVQLTFAELPDLSTQGGLIVFLQALNDVLVQIQKNSLQNLNQVRKTLQSDLTTDVTLFVAATSGGAVTTPLRIKNGIPVSTGFTAPTNAPPGNNATTTVPQSGSAHPARPYP